MSLSAEKKRLAGHNRKGEVVVGAMNMGNNDDETEVRRSLVDEKSEVLKKKKKQNGETTTHDNDDNDKDVKQTTTTLMSTQSKWQQRDRNESGNHDTSRNSHDRAISNKVSLMEQRSTTHPSPPPTTATTTTTATRGRTDPEKQSIHNLSGEFIESRTNENHTDDDMRKPGAISVENPLGKQRALSETRFLMDDDDSISCNSSLNNDRIDENDTGMSLIKAELVNEEEIARKALESIVHAHAEPWTSTGNIGNYDDDDDNDDSPSPKSRKGRILWAALLVILVVVGVTLIVTLTSSEGDDGNNERDPSDQENPLNPIIFPTSAPTTAAPSTAPTTYQPTQTPTANPTSLVWESTARLEGTFHEDWYGDNLVGEGGRFGWDVALTPGLRSETGEEINVNVWATFAEDQMFFGRRRELLAFAQIYRMASFTCDKYICSDGLPVEIFGPDLPDNDFQFLPWTFSFTEYGDAMVVVGSDEFLSTARAFVIYDLSFAEELTYVDASIEQGLIDAKISQNGDFVACLLPTNVTILEFATEESLSGWTIGSTRAFPVQQMVTMATAGRFVAAAGHHNFSTLLVPENLPFTGYTLQVFDVDTGLQVGQTIQAPEGESILSSKSLAMANNGTIIALGTSQEEIPRSIGFANRQDEGIVSVWQLSYDTLNQTMWTPMGSVLGGGRRGNMFGHSVALSQDGMTLAVGAPNDPTNSVGAGLVSVYRFDGTNWRQLGEDLLGQSPTSSFGWSVDVSADGNYVVVGAPGSDDLGTDVGQVFFFSLVGV